MASSETEPDTSHSAKIVSTVTHHTLVLAPGGATGAKSKSKPKDKKDIKTKEFLYCFEASADNYLELLKTLLLRHGEEKYNISMKMVYYMKVQLPGTKKAEALDIDTCDEYKDLVSEHILDAKPSKLTIFVDMADIQKRWNQKKGFDEGSDNEDINGDSALYDSNGLSDLDRSLARFRGILEKKWQNDHDAGYTYIDPNSAKSYPLTPQMMKEWARAMHDGLANCHTAPEHMNLFAMANRQVALHPARIAAGVNQPQATSDIGHLATILTAFMGPRGVAGVPEQPLFPRTPPKRNEQRKPISPVIPTPFKLPRFLEHASTNLGVTSAPSFATPMRRNGYGPDILHLVEDRDLMDIRMTTGDAIRLKAGAQAWWNGPEANKKRSYGEMSEADSAGSSFGRTFTRPSDILATPPSKKVSFERHWDDGGAERFYGPRIVEGDDDDQIELDLWSAPGVGAQRGEQEAAAAEILTGFRNGA
ncbi:hypothetical protein DFH09DRAFT_1400559 [Mycena vulgaris]|nr:hypothetical protein DFH09DRAFT_1400559 [Mycena vulgaris]